MGKSLLEFSMEMVLVLVFLMWVWGFII